MNRIVLVAGLMGCGILLGGITLLRSTGHLVQYAGELQPSQKHDYIIYLTAEWCGPCRMMNSVVEKAKQQYSITVVDVDKNPLAKQYHVGAIPAMLYFHCDQPKPIVIVGYVEFDKMVEKLEQKPCDKKLGVDDEEEGDLREVWMQKKWRLALEIVWDAIDHDQNGEIQMQEWLEFIGKYAPTFFQLEMKLPMTFGEKTFRVFFKALDTDNDGKWRRRETLDSALCLMHYSAKCDPVYQLMAIRAFGALDENHDRQITGEDVLSIYPIEYTTDDRYKDLRNEVLISLKDTVMSRESFYVFAMKRAKIIWGDEEERVADQKLE